MTAFHSLSRLTVFSYHGIFTKIFALASFFHSLCHCPPSDHSVHLGQPHNSLQTGLSASTASFAAMATTPPCSTILPNPITETHLVRLEGQPFGPLSPMHWLGIARFSNYRSLGKLCLYHLGTEQR